MSVTLMLDIALDYARRGWLVFPLHTPDAEGRCSCHKDCGRDNGKHPRTMNGCKDATTDEETIRRWWRMWSDANIGIATGARSGFIVLDVDPRHGGDESLAELERAHGELPATLEAHTGGGGRHLFFKHPGFSVSNSSGKVGRGLDVRGDGGYIVAAPSLHQSGGRYQWKH